MPDSDGYRIPEVQKAVGISYRQLDYWARTGLVRPSVRDAQGSGTQRLYSFEDLVQLRVIKKLLDAGVSLQRVRRAIDFLRDHLKRAPQSVTLMSDGSNIYAFESPTEIFDLLQRGQGVFGIAVDKVWNELEATLKKGTRPAARAGGA